MKVDAIALHWYGTDAKDFIAYVTDMHNTFNKPIWVTEFACQNFAGGAQCSWDQVFDFMRTVTSFMDGASFVQEYFAFGKRSCIWAYLILPTNVISQALCMTCSMSTLPTNSWRVMANPLTSVVSTLVPEELKLLPCGPTI